MSNRIVRDIEKARAEVAELRRARDDAAASLRACGFTSAEMAEVTNVQMSRVRHYWQAGSVGGQYTTLTDFERAFDAWEHADAWLSRLCAKRDNAVIEAITGGARQQAVADEYGISQFLVSYIMANRQEGTLI